MSKLTNSASVNSALEGASTTGTLNLYSLPMSVFTISHGVTNDGKRAKVILKSALQNDAIGTIQLYAPFGKDAELLEEFKAGSVIDGSKAQDLGYYFELSNGSNYQWVSEETAIALMSTTGLNSSVMQFPAANKKLTREQLQTVKNINAGNTGKVAVTTEGGINTWLSNVSKLFN